MRGQCLYYFRHRFWGTEAVATAFHLSTLVGYIVHMVKAKAGVSNRRVTLMHYFDEFYGDVLHRGTIPEYTSISFYREFRKIFFHDLHSTFQEAWDGRTENSWKDLDLMTCRRDCCDLSLVTSIGNQLKTSYTSCIYVSYIYIAVCQWSTYITEYLYP